MAMTQVLSDDFNRADANPIGSPWFTVTGATANKIVSNQVQGAANGGVRCVSYYGDSRIANMRCTFTIAAHNSGLGQLGSVVRLNTTTYDGYTCLATSEYNIYLVVAFGFTLITNTTGNTPVVNNTIGMQVIGSTVKAFEDGTEVLSQTDSTLLVGTWGMDISVFSTNALSSEVVDSFVGEADITGAPPTTNSINAYFNAWF